MFLYDVHKYFLLFSLFYTGFFSVLLVTNIFVIVIDFLLHKNTLSTGPLAVCSKSILGHVPYLFYTILLPFAVILNFAPSISHARQRTRSHRSRILTGLYNNHNGSFSPRWFGDRYKFHMMNLPNLYTSSTSALHAFLLHAIP